MRDRSELKPGDYICLSVTDNGEGMDDDTLANATAPFFTTKGVVDDDQLVLTNAVLMIEDLGHATTPAQSAEEALKILSENCNFDLVITDHAMPKTTGSQLAGMIEQKWPGLPVVLATGYADLPQGADRTVARLPKPYSQAQLVVAISQAVEP
jgi:CheY-like chemotaxis protein